MGIKKLQSCELNENGLRLNSQLGFQWTLKDDCFYPLGGFFASVGQSSGSNDNGFSPKISNSLQESETFKISNQGILVESGAMNQGILVEDEEGDVNKKKQKQKKKKSGLNLKIKVKNPSLRRLISGAIAGAVSRTAVAPLETIRTHLMVGTCGHSAIEVFNNIVKDDGWKGLFRGNFVNVIRVAPNKAIELFAYDTVNKSLSPKPGEKPKFGIPPSLIAGACAGVSSNLVTYPLELVKTRLTIQRGVYKGLFDAFVKILQEGGPGELYRGLTPSLIGVIPYAALNYFAYDTLRKTYKKVFKQDRVGNIETLLIGSAAGAISSSATFPLEVARKQMQVGALSGRKVYNDVFHAILSILEEEGMNGLYKGLGPSCMKLMPAAGISFMCYEAMKRVLVDDKEDDE